MEHIDQLRTLGLFDQRVPRYTSYPTAPVFSTDTGSAFQVECIRALDPAAPVSVYVHIPFCERLCWFCACRTQGTRTLSPVESYLGTLEAELTLLAKTLPAGIKMGRLHWGGGTPTILPPHMINRLAQAIKAAIPPAERFEFSVEIDPTMVDDAKIAALQAEGMSRASIGIQDFSEDVQEAIGREQSFEATKRCVDALRAAGITSLNTDLVYGLPHQTLDKIAASVERVLTLNPDRVALFGYAHVPHMAKRQNLIDQAHLPGDQLRYHLFQKASEMFVGAGYAAIGIDHFAKPADALSRASQAGTLRRNFQGYTEDDCSSLIGLGASSISSYPQGYVQNAAATGAYMQRIEAGTLAGYRGHPLSQDDVLHARAIEMLMCDFALDLDQLQHEFGENAAQLAPTHAEVARKFAPFITLTDSALAIKPEGHPLTRIIASAYDAYAPAEAQYSKAS
ncbi:oxygen-independent coproporphyrinogen III oxidase [Aliiroseovarius sp. YM-037]|uniref:oxygen-independent coproporphyrinogen III oxidase n=1 Tax=Aliiroseovarius sp. YM-037 TaxID=3341728 RepID=UPI003A7FD4C3